MGPTSDFSLIAGGGTAGHVLPGLAIARALVERGHPADQIHFVGSERGIDARLVPEAGFSLTTLPGRGLQRRLTIQNVAALWGLLRAVVRAFGVVRARRPAVVVVVGGYASVACAVAAVVWRVPIVVAEQNARAGLANRLAGRFAKACAVAFPGTDLPRAVVTGNPVRDEVLAVDRPRDRVRAREDLGLPPDRTTILAFSGSLGSTRINDAVRGMVASLADRSDLAVRHVVGSRDWEGFRGEDRDGRSGLLYQAIEYEEQMARALAAADLAVCRAGGTTVAELAVVGLPAVLVPLPIAPRDHQTANSRALVDAGAAVLVADADLDAARLVAEVSALVADPAELATMGRQALSLARPDAADRVAALVEEHARAR